MVRKILTCLFIGIISFMIGFVEVDTYNFYNANYEIKFSVNEKFEYQKLENKDYLLTIVNSAEKYSEINIEKMIKNNDVNIVKDGNNYTITTGFEYYEEFFISKSKTKGTRVKQFFKDAISGLIDESLVKYEYSDVFIVTNEVNRFIPALISSITGVIISAVYLVYKKDDKKIEYDNKNFYRTPFYKSYWKNSMKFLNDTKKIVTIAMLFALMMVCKIFALPSGFSNLGISLTYLFLSIIGLIYGPIAGLTIGFFSDVLGYFLFDKSGQAFYIGYSIQAMLAGFTYGLFFYKTKITFTKCFFSRLIVNLLLNVVWGSICLGDIMGYDYETIKMYALIIALPKNLIYLIPQSILLFVFLKFVIPILYRSKYISRSVKESVSVL